MSTVSIIYDGSRVLRAQHVNSGIIMFVKWLKSAKTQKTGRATKMTNCGVKFYFLSLTTTMGQSSPHTIYLLAVNFWHWDFEAVVFGCRDRLFIQTSPNYTKLHITLHSPALNLCLYENNYGNSTDMGFIRTHNQNTKPVIWDCIHSERILKSYFAHR